MGEGINMPAPGVGAVYGAMAKATRMLAAIGVDKSSQNAAQGFNFRGIDAVLGAMSKVLVECGLFILPTVEDHAITMLVDDKSKKTKFRAQVTVGYHITSVEDSSRVHTCVCAEAIDSQDKATSKALSMAYKYFAFQTFCIPLKGVLDDADADSPMQETSTVPMRATATFTADDRAAEPPAAESYSAEATSLLLTLGLVRDQDKLQTLRKQLLGFRGQEVFAELKTAYKAAEARLKTEA